MMPGGMRLLESPYLPEPNKIELSTKVQVSPAFRAEFNAWLRERFGTRPAPAYIMSGPFGDYVVASPAMMRELRKRAAKAEL